MSIVIVIAPTNETAATAWASLQQANVADAEPSRRERLTPLQVQQIMLKTVQQRRGLSLALTSTAEHSFSNTHTLDKIWTELAADLVLANVDAPRFGWYQTLDAHTPGFWQRFDPHTRFVLVYENPAQFVARNLIGHDQIFGNDNTTDFKNSQSLLENWHASHSTLLDTFYVLGADAVLVHADQVGFASALLGLSESVILSTEQARQTSPGADLLTRLLRPLIGQDAQAHSLWQELQAAAHAPMVETSDDSQTAVQNLDDCLQLQSELLGAQQALDAALRQEPSVQDQLAVASQALQAEVAARAEVQQQLVASQNDNTRLVEQHRQQLNEAEQEGELLIAQLHQVQEELEKYFIQHGEEQKARELEAQAKLEAIQQRDEEAQAKAHLQALLEAETHARQHDAALHVTALAVAQEQLNALQQENTRQAEQHRQQVQESTDEGDLLMAQLHQVQEELEHYFVRYQEQRKQLQSVTKFWRQHPPSELWVDMRRTDDGYGWYEAESDGRWSGPGNESTIELPPLAAGQYLLELHIADAMAPELVADMKLVAQLADGQELPLSLVHEFGAANGIFPMVSAGVLQLPANLLGQWQLNLVLPQVVCLAEQGGEDTRQLGLRLQGLRLSLQEPDTPDQASDQA
jgi:chemotaxis protein histidine kinase CheA